ncbi:hypothetical protein ACQYWQ_29350 [Streptomyces sp. P6-2-1]|uniref:hypothetical protein n=1 Tax=Streptomyces sp. P6-2-1 TaxID=3422591 RepID=UPI003D368291
MSSTRKLLAVRQEGPTSSGVPLTTTLWRRSDCWKTMRAKALVGSFMWGCPVRTVTSLVSKDTLADTGR